MSQWVSLLIGDDYLVDTTGEKLSVQQAPSLSFRIFPEVKRERERARERAGEEVKKVERRSERSYLYFTDQTQSKKYGL
jgi:hypothetical protein